MFQLKPRLFVHGESLIKLWALLMWIASLVVKKERKLVAFIIYLVESTHHCWLNGHYLICSTKWLNNIYKKKKKKKKKKLFKYFNWMMKFCLDFLLGTVDPWQNVFYNCSGNETESRVLHCILHLEFIIVDLKLLQYFFLVLSLVQCL